MPDVEHPPVADAPELLSSPEAGGMVIRGGTVRGIGYGVGWLVGGGTAVLLLRYLGVQEFGRWVTVASLMGIVSGVTDAGLSAVGSREMALRTPGEERDRLLGNLVTLRLLTTVAGVLLATLFTIVAGYDRVLVYGSLLAGLGVLLVSYQVTLMTPLTVELRQTAITAVEIWKQAVLLIATAVLVLVGASLLPFFTVQIAVGLAALAVTPWLVGGLRHLRPRLEWATGRALLREALPVAVAIAMNTIYFRVLVILMSLLATETETGLFGTSFRIFEVLYTLPTLVLSVALPVLAVAGRDDHDRLRYATQRLADVGLIVATLVVLTVVFLAGPIIAILAGPDYRDAVPVLQIQVISLIPMFLGQTCQLALVALRRQRALAVANTIALAAVFVLGLVTIPEFGEIGAAVVAAVAECLLGGMLLLSLHRSAPDVAPSLGVAWRIAPGAAAGALLLLLPGVPDALLTPIAVGLFALGVVASGALPPELLVAFRSRLRHRPLS